tara:strand:+ start:30802 stop:31539 length:738 start_codon:yes stop_codon:yes gene_type:complete
MLVVEKLDDGLPRVAVVDIVTEARGVDDGKADWELSASVNGWPADAPTLEELLLQLGLGDLNFDGLVHLLVVSSLVVGIVLDGCGEERVDEGRLSEARLAGNLCMLAVPRARAVRGPYHDGEGSAALCNDLVPVLRQASACVFSTGSIPLVGQLQCRVSTIQDGLQETCTYIGNANWGQVLGHGAVCAESAVGLWGCAGVNGLHSRAGVDASRLTEERAERSGSGVKVRAPVVVCVQEAWWCRRW